MVGQVLLWKEWVFVDSPMRCRKALTCLDIHDFCYDSLLRCLRWTLLTVQCTAPLSSFALQLTPVCGDHINDPHSAFQHAG